MIKVLVDGQTLATPEMERGIGKVFRRLVEGMVVSDISRRWLIALPDTAALSRIGKQVVDALEPVVIPTAARNGSPLEQDREYAAKLQAAIGEARPDWYWNPNPLMTNVRYPLGLEGVRKAITLHDLIPLSLPDDYLNRWGPEVAENYHARLRDIASSASVILPVSASTASAFSEMFPSSEGLLRQIAPASDFFRMRPLRCGAAMSKIRYVVYIGGFDPRKNMPAAVEAFARFWSQLASDDRDVRLKILGASAGLERNSLTKLARSLGVQDSVDVLDYVDEETLAKLIQEAHVFFYPSRYEGFGLPALDALACGIPVVASDAAAIPEVCGAHAFYCNPADVGDMARGLNAAWEARKRRLGPWLENAAYARANFSWEKACDQYLETLSGQTAQQRAPVGDMRYRPSVAYLSPWPPQRSGVADYSYSVVQRLKNLCAVTVYTSAETPRPMDGVDIRDIDQFESDAHQYDQAIYHIGNGQHHKEIYFEASRLPGIVVLHDFNIHPFMQAFVLRTPHRAMYRDALRWYGTAGEVAWEHFVTSGAPAMITAFAMSEPLVTRSRAVIVHSRWAARSLENLGVPVFASHLGADTTLARSGGDTQRARQNLGLKTDHLYIGVFGFVNTHKRVHATIAAVAALRAEGLPVLLIVVGEVNDSRVDLEALRVKHGLEPEAIIQTGFVKAERFAEYLTAVDVVVNLRYPTMGESSASLFDAFARHVPAVVSNVGQFAELPDAATWKVDIGQNEERLLIAYLRHLLKHPRTRCALADNAHAFIRRFASFENTAIDYRRIAAQIAR